MACFYVVCTFYYLWFCEDYKLFECFFLQASLVYLKCFFCENRNVNEKLILTENIINIFKVVSLISHQNIGYTVKLRK